VRQVARDTTFAPFARAGVSAGRDLTRTLAIELGLDVFAMFATGGIGTPDGEVSAGLCPNADPHVCGGRGVVAVEKLLGDQVIVVLPTLGLRWRL